MTRPITGPELERLRVAAYEADDALTSALVAVYGDRMAADARYGPDSMYPPHVQACAQRKKAADHAYAVAHAEVRRREDVRLAGACTCGTGDPSDHRSDCPWVPGGALPGMRRAWPVDVDTTHFEFAHGRKPRGRGGWAFFFESTRNEPEWAPGGGILYADAKRWAVNEARRRGVSVVYVAS